MSKLKVLSVVVVALILALPSQANDKNKQNNQAGPMVEKRALGNGHIAFHIASGEDKPVEVSGPLYSGMRMSIVCAGPNKVHYYVADDHGPLRDGDCSGDIDVGNQVKLVIPEGITGLAKIFVQGKFEATSGAAYYGPIIQIGRAGDVDDACKYINGLFNPVPTNTDKKAEAPASWQSEIKLYFLGEEILLGLGEFGASVRHFQEIGDEGLKQALIKKMDRLNDTLKAQIREYKPLSTNSALRDDSSKIYSFAQMDLEVHQGDLESIHKDPSMYIKESFRAFSGGGPSDWLADMRRTLLASTEARDGSHKDNLTASVAYLLQLTDAQNGLEHELASLGHPNGKTITGGKAKTDLSNLERLASASPEMHQHTVESLDAIRSLAALLEQLKGMAPEKRTSDGPGRNKKLWDEISSKTKALSLAHGHLRQEVLTQL